MIRIRWDALGREARASLARAAEQMPDVRRTPLAMMGRIFEAHAMHAAVPGERGATSSAEFVARYAYPKPDREEMVGAGSGGLTIHMDADTARALIDRLRPAGDEDEQGLG